jgi:heptose-I-phosphate ethanolaminephosphotransferase
VSSLIQRFSSQQSNGFLLYLSDHGEAVFDPEHPEVLGRNEAAPTAPMYTIPFMLWRSPQWRESHPLDLSANLGRPYSSSSFIHTWSDLAGIRFDGFDPSRSLVNNGFQARPLLIGDPYRPKALIDFSLIKPKARPADIEVVSGALPGKRPQG